MITAEQIIESQREHPENWIGHVFFCEDEETGVVIFIDPFEAWRLHREMFQRDMRPD